MIEEVVLELKAVPNKIFMFAYLVKIVWRLKET